MQQRPQNRKRKKSTLQFYTFTRGLIAEGDSFRIPVGPGRARVGALSGTIVPASKFKPLVGATTLVSFQSYSSSRRVIVYYVTSRTVRFSPFSSPFPPPVNPSRSYEDEDGIRVKWAQGGVVFDRTGENLSALDDEVHQLMMKSGFLDGGLALAS